MQTITTEVMNKQTYQTVVKSILLGYNKRELNTGINALVIAPTHESAYNYISDIVKGKFNVERIQPIGLDSHDHSYTSLDGYVILTSDLAMLSDRYIMKLAEIIQSIYNGVQSNTRAAAYGTPRVRIVCPSRAIETALLGALFEIYKHEDLARLEIFPVNERANYIKYSSTVERTCPVQLEDTTRLRAISIIHFMSGNYRFKEDSVPVHIGKDVLNIHPETLHSFIYRLTSEQKRIVLIDDEVLHMLFLHEISGIRGSTAYDMLCGEASAYAEDEVIEISVEQLRQALI